MAFLSGFAIRSQSVFGMALISFAALIAASATPALADVIVLQSSAPSLASGQTIKGAGKIVVPSGKSAVLMLPNGSTKTVAGPFEGTADSLTKGLDRNAALIDSVTNFIKTGGATTSNVGATRGLGPARPQASASSGRPFSWREVPIEASGDVCIEKGAPLSLTRARSQGDQDITLVDMATAKRAIVSFKAGEVTAAWPAQIDPAGGGIAVLVPNATMQRIRLQQVENVPGESETVARLYAQRCVSQMQAYLKGLSGR